MREVRVGELPEFHDPPGIYGEGLGGLPIRPDCGPDGKVRISPRKTGEEIGHLFTDTEGKGAMNAVAKVQ